jgi:hypothetical protein
VDTNKPSSARIDDAHLGGDHNRAVDQKFARDAGRQFPLIKPLARANRSGTHRDTLSRRTIEQQRAETFRPWPTFLGDRVRKARIGQ